MTLHQLTDASLLDRFQKLVRTERKITHLVLECIAEIDRRKLYLDKAYPSLFEYLTEAFGYSAGAAQRRIASARLLREVPELAPKLEAGTINLSQIALAVQTIKVAEKKFAAKMDGDAKLELIEKLEAKSFVETQKVLRAELKVELATPERTQHHADGSVTLSLTLTQEQFADLKRARELNSHSTSDGKWADLIHRLAKSEISRRTEIRRASDSEVTRKNKSRNSRQIPPNLRKKLLRNATCGFRDPVTRKTCGSRHFLQIDHVHPICDGGTRAAHNLQVLCGAHNRRRFTANNSH